MNLTVQIGQSVTRATVFAPRHADTVVFCYPGGGYGRGYFDLHPAGATGYSQAEHHADQGFVVVAVDHATPVNGMSAAAEHNAAAATELLRQLRTLVPLAPDVAVVGVGQSMGAAILTVQQADHRTFDAVALLGWSAVHTALPDPPAGVVPRGPAHFRWAYHWDDEPEWLVDADIGPSYPDRHPVCPPWGSTSRPAPVEDVLRPGCVAPWAARVDVPVLLGFGERDVAADPAAEPAMYPASPRVDLVRFERVAHMHNFGSGRAPAWDRLARFYREAH